MMPTLPQLLAEVATNYAHKVAVVEGERILTYNELARHVQSRIEQLQLLGVEQGDPVAFLLPNSLQFVVSFLAVVELGAIVVPLNARYQDDELRYFVNDSGASVLVTLKERQTQCRRVLEELRRRCDILPVQDDVDLELLSASSQREQEVSLLPTDVHPSHAVTCQYSSGSTGRPKRVLRTHSNLTFELESLAKTLGIDHRDKFLGAMPFSHINGLMRSMLASLSVGATLIVLREFRRQQLVSAIEQHGATVFIGAPFMFGILAEMNLRRPIDFSSLRLCISASAPMPINANKMFYERYGHYVRQLYGSTETGTISVNVETKIENSLESVGLPIEGVEVVLFNEDGKRAQVNEVGEVAVNSPAAITRYQSQPDSSQSFRDGYFLTGDLGMLDTRGLLYLVGRKKFFVNKGGYKINPREVEALLERHDNVKEVVVMGVPTRYGDERLKAVVVSRHPCSEDELIMYCRGKIADFKIPSFIEFRQQLPKTGTGKLLRDKLR